MKKIYLGLLISLLSTVIHAQGFNLEWGKSMGGTNWDAGQSITTDASGNVYITGYYEGTVDFDPSVSTFNLTPIGASDIFIQKLDADGNFIWAKSFGGSGYDFGTCITTDASGNLYVIGTFDGTADFDPSVSTFNLTSNGGFDVFVQKLDSNGNFIWAKSFGGTGFDSGTSVITDVFGNVIVIGYYYDMVDFDPGMGTFNLTSNGFKDVFIQKLDASGDFLWANSIGGPIQDIDCHSITTDTWGNVYVTGDYLGTLDFDPSAGTFNLTSMGSSDIFIQKLDASGDFLWAKSMGANYVDEGYSITTDITGFVYVTGTFRETVDFDPSAATFNLTSVNSADVFIEKLDASGNFIWAKSMGGTLDDYGKSITTDSLDNVYVVGNFVDEVDFDPNEGTFILNSNGGRDVYIQKLDVDGNFISAKSMDGTGYEYDYFFTAKPFGNLYVTGYFEGTADFDPSGATFNLNSNGSKDVFIQKLSYCAPNILVNPSSSSITSNAIGASYQWLDCSNYAVITGDTAQNFTTAVSGDYAVEVTENGCVDTSACITILDIEENTLFNSVSIFPNPNSGQVNIDLGNLKEVSIKVFSVGGRLIYHKENINASIHQIEFNEEPGVYFIELSSQGKKQHYKLVKK